ncbi:hypothetical protein KJ068_30190 [bacterium]|nr:hypothetical protein [bacterium]
MLLKTPIATIGCFVSREALVVSLQAAKAFLFLDELIGGWRGVRFLGESAAAFERMSHMLFSLKAICMTAQAEMREAREAQYQARNPFPCPACEERLTI